MSSPMRQFVVVVSGLALLGGLAVEAGAGQVRCPITGKTYNVRGKQKGGGTCVVQNAPKMSLVRTVSHDGNVKYYTVSSAKAAEQKRAQAQKDYEEALEKWNLFKTTFENGSKDTGFKYEKPMPMAPAVEVLAKDVDGKSAAWETQRKESKNDWAVYEIAMGTTTKREIGYGRCQTYIKARADALYAGVYNQWKRGGEQGDAPTEPVISKVADGLSKSDARRELAKL